MPQEPIPSLEIHVPISPNAKFMRMTRCLVTSLRHNGGLYANAPVIVTLGEDKIADKELKRDYPWLKTLGIETRWVPEDRFKQRSYYATATDRLTYKFNTDMVLMLDADMLVARPFDDLVRRLHREQKVGAVVAYACPFDDGALWQKVYDACSMGKVNPIHEHPGWPYLYPQRPRYCPPYFNLGFLLMPSAFASQIGAHMYELMDRVSEIEMTIYRCQLAFGLAVTKLDLPYECLPLRYNFANNKDLEALHGDEQAFASILHLIWNHQGVWKDDLFGQADGIEKILARDDLAGINKQAQQVLRQIWPEIS